MELDRKMLFELIGCAKREVSLRYRVYPKRIVAGYLTQADADREIKLMKTIQALLENVYNEQFPEPIQQSFLNAQEYIKKEHWHR